MSGKKTTSTNQVQNTSSATANTSTPNVPTWISDPAQAMAQQVSQFQTQGPDAYRPGVSDLQTQATQAAGALGTSGYYGQAGDTLNNLPGVTNGGGYQTIDNGGSIGNIEGGAMADYIANGGSIDTVYGQSLLDNLSAYYNPFKDQVLNPVLADYDQQSGMTRAAQAAAAAKGGAFGGSRYGIQEAQTEDALARGRASTEGGLLNQMYTSATGLSADDANRRQAAALANQQGQENTAARTLAASQSNQQAQENYQGRQLTAAQANQQAQINEAMRQLQAETANQSAGLTVGGRTQAAELANQAAALQKAGLLTGLGSAQDSSNRANVALQDQIGAQATDLENAQRQYDLQFQAQQESLLSGLNPALYTGQTSTGSNSGTSTTQGNSTSTDSMGALGALGSAAQIASMFTPAGAAASAAGGLFNSFRQTPSPSWSAYGT